MAEERIIYKIKNYLRNLDIKTKREQYETRNIIIFQLSLLRKWLFKESRFNRLYIFFIFVAFIVILVSCNTVLFYLLRNSLAKFLNERSHDNFEDKTLIKQSNYFDLLSPKYNSIDKSTFGSTTIAKTSKIPTIFNFHKKSATDKLFSPTTPKTTKKFSVERLPDSWTHPNFVFSADKEINTEREQFLSSSGQTVDEITTNSISTKGKTRELSTDNDYSTDTSDSSLEPANYKASTKANSLTSKATTVSTSNIEVTTNTFNTVRGNATPTAKRHLLDLDSYRLNLSYLFFQLGKFIYDFIDLDGNIYFVARYNYSSRGLFVVDPKYGAIKKLEFRHDCRLKSITLMTNNTLIALCYMKYNPLEGMVLSSDTKGLSWNLMFKLDYRVSQVRVTEDNRLIISTIGPCSVIGFDQNGTVIWERRISRNSRANIATIGREVAVVDLHGKRGLLFINSTDGNIVRAKSFIEKDSSVRNIYLFGFENGLLLNQKSKRGKISKISMFSIKGDRISYRDFDRFYSAVVFSNGTETLFMAGQSRIDAFNFIEF